ncbi:hypothetical protein FGB62_308g07 [Gracilaria domingensis]|nr:hypothetical protein FGB62_308g07 [Gracilaria domingensis]
MWQLTLSAVAKSSPVPQATIMVHGVTCFRGLGNAVRRDLSVRESRRCNPWGVRSAMQSCIWFTITKMRKMVRSSGIRVSEFMFDGGRGTEGNGVSVRVMLASDYEVKENGCE